MTLQVIGPGLGRTGTFSLKLALERLLGGRCHHMAEVLADPDRHLALWAPVLRGEPVDWNQVFAGYVAQVDFPGAECWRRLSEAFPDALVVLSTRPPDDWYRSAAATIFQLDDDHGSSPFRQLWQDWFGERSDDPATVIAAYERHNAEVRASAPAGKLVDWQPSDGWGPLCEALDLPVPAEPFPHLNKREDFPRPTADMDLPEAVDRLVKEGSGLQPSEG